MIVEEIRAKVIEMINNIDAELRLGIPDLKQYKTGELLAKFYAVEVGKSILSKSLLMNILHCLEADNNNYNCFVAITPILKSYPNKKEWLPVLGLLLSKARKSKNEDITNNKGNNNISYQFLNNIVDNNGNFLPYLITGKDRFAMEVLGMNKDQISVVSKQCRSLYKENNPKVEKEPVIVKGIVVDSALSQRNIKNQRQLLYFLKSFLSLGDNEIVSSRFITDEEIAKIISTLEELNFDKDRIEFIKNKIQKFNCEIKNNDIARQLQILKRQLFTDEMYGKYMAAIDIINDSSFVYKNIKDKLNDLINYIESILVNYINKCESFDDTCEYLVMAFDDLSNELKLCGPRLVLVK